MQGRTTPEYIRVSDGFEIERLDSVSRGEESPDGNAKGPGRKRGRITRTSQYPRELP